MLFEILIIAFNYYYEDLLVNGAVLLNIIGSRGQAVMVVKCEKIVTGSHLGWLTLYNDIEI